MLKKILKRRKENKKAREECLQSLAEKNGDLTDDTKRRFRENLNTHTKKVKESPA